jgi:hypothetical protein
MVSEVSVHGHCLVAFGPEVAQDIKTGASSKKALHLLAVRK